MTQQEFNSGVLEVLARIAEKLGEGRRLEPKHGIVGGELRVMIQILDHEQPQ